MGKLYCKLDELAKLYCKFDEFAKLRMSSISWVSCTVSWVSWLSCTVSWIYSSDKKFEENVVYLLSNFCLKDVCEGMGAKPA